MFHGDGGEAGKPHARPKPCDTLFSKQRLRQESPGSWAQDSTCHPVCRRLKEEAAKTRLA